MNHEQAYNFLISVLKQITISDDYKVFKELGFNYFDFPVELVGDVREFERIAKNNLKLAKIKKSKFSEFETSFKTISINDFANNYHAAVKVVKCYEFVNSVKSNPLDAERLASEFLKKKNNAVELLDLKELIEPTILKIEEQLKNGTFEILIPGWENLSKTVGGFNPGCVFILTAKSGVGKTSLALNIATSAVEKMNVLYFNMEMLIDDLMKRVFMSKGEVTKKDLTNGNFYKDQKFHEWFSKTIGNENKLLLSDGRALSLDQITSTIAKENENQKLGLVIIDYDQKIKTENISDQWKELHKAIEQIEETAKFCKLPVIMLAQANDDGDIRASKRMKQSASAEMEFKFMENAKYNENGKNKVGCYVVELKKNRHGQNGKIIRIDFNLEKNICTEKDYVETIFKKEEPNRNF